MENNLIDLQNNLFEVIKTLKNKELKAEALREEIARAMAINELAITAVRNGELMVRAADILYGIPVSDKLPLIPKSESEKQVIVSKGRNVLLEIPNSNKRI